MKLVRQLLTFVVTGALLAVLIASWMGIEIIGAGPVENLLAKQGAAALLHYQMSSLPIGAVTGLALGVAWAVWRRKVAADKAREAPKPPPPAA